ncbi:hypothetical protein C943_02270 [Mariniradius saccharolyticus AK6]|uniref:Uncharacterized protein n=1 Tax=Mariniradius saccharolyticus AK6 TaxID=1239962 RepID=M7XCN7_9BACT|nr:hypothetical protein C943_02270 [Mariniradius saccharolyticus AK6]
MRQMGERLLNILKLHFKYCFFDLMKQYLQNGIFLLKNFVKSINKKVFFVIDWMTSPGI